MIGNFASRMPDSLPRHSDRKEKKKKKKGSLEIYRVNSEFASVLYHFEMMQFCSYCLAGSAVLNFFTLDCKGIWMLFAPAEHFGNAEVRTVKFHFIFWHCNTGSDCKTFETKLKMCVQISQPREYVFELINFSTKHRAMVITNNYKISMEERQACEFVNL